MRPIKNDDGYFAFRYLVVDIPSSYTHLLIFFVPDMHRRLQRPASCSRIRGTCTRCIRVRACLTLGIRIDSSAHSAHPLHGSACWKIRLQRFLAFTHFQLTLSTHAPITTQQSVLTPLRRGGLAQYCIISVYMKCYHPTRCHTLIEVARSSFSEEFLDALQD